LINEFFLLKDGAVGIDEYNEKDMFQSRGYFSREKDVLYASKNFLNKGDVVYDVGGNIGHLSFYFSKFVGSNGKVFAFEPNKNLSKIFLKTIKNTR
jgi:ubiquinone/menaquinone biosynthesis C-methylase UbiE